MDWLACCLDLNPIETLSGTLAREVYARNRQFDDVESLKEAVFHTLDSIALHQLGVLVGSVPMRGTAVLEKKGGVTKY